MMALRLLIAGGALALLALPAHAQTWVPTAAGTYTWNDPNNWSPAGVPLTGTANVNTDIAGDQTITLDSTPNLTALNIGDLTITPNPGGAFNGITIAAGSGGPLQFAAGTLASQNSVNVISAPITLNGGLTVTHLISGIPSPTPSQQVGSLTLSGPINLNGNTLTVGQTSSSLARLDRGVVISGVMSGAGGLTKSGGGFLVLSGANDYTGPTTLAGGAVRLVGSGTIGTGNLALSGGGQFFPGTATFTRSLNTTGDNTVQIAGTAGFGAIDQDLTINFGGNATPDTIVWGATGFTPTQFGLSSTSSNRTITVVNPIDLNGVTREVRVDSGTAQVDAVLSGGISGTGGFTKSGDGLLDLTAPNTYAGVTTIGANGVLRISNDSALGTTAGATTILGAARTNRIELSGGVTVAEPITLQGRNGGTNLSVALSSVNGSNTLTGNITFATSGVEYSVAADTGSTFTISGNITSTLTGAAGTVRNLNLSGAGTGIITGLISSTNDPMAIFKTGTGTWTLGGSTPHTYAGATTVNAGTLRVNGTLAAGGGAVAVNSGGTLGGTGTVNRAVTVASGGTLAPGAGGAGVLTVANASATAVDLPSGANFGVRITGGNPSGTFGGSTDSVTTPTTNNVLRVTAGTASIDPGINIVVDWTGMSFTLEQQYSYQVGQVDGQNLSGLNITDAARFQFAGLLVEQPSLTGNESGAIFLTFTPVPEPGSVLLVGALGTVATAGWRRLRSRRGDALEDV